jgi:signal transduction histidine kinase
MKSLPLAIIVCLLVVSAGLAVIWTSSSMQAEISRRVGNSLETVLNTTHEALRTWEERTTANAGFIANSEEIRAAVEKQIRVRHERADLFRSDALPRLRQILHPYIEQRGYSDFAIIATDGIQIASGLDEFIGQDSIAKLNSPVLTEVFAGMASVGEPFQLPTDPHRTGYIRINMIVGAPIFDESGEVIAALVFRLDPAEEFGSVTRVGRPGRTGETYIFDKQGRLLTQSRFEQDLLRLLPENRSAAVGVHQFPQLRDPGVDTTEGFVSRIPRNQQPLTHMAESAIRGESGTDLNGYRDYRGVPVVGAWIWDEGLGLGLATEMAVSEAKAPIKTIWTLSIIMLIIVITTVFLLVRVVGHRAQLQTQNFGYEQALQARQDLLAIVAHDLRNPINSIALSSSVLTKALEGNDPNLGFVAQNLGVIHRSAFRMNRLIEDLLTSTRIEAGQLQVRPQHCDLRPLLRDLEQLVRPVAAEKSIQFVYSISPDVPNAFIDPDRLSQILWNLVGNAIKYAPAHGVVSLSVQLVNGQIEFRVRDTGPGIAPGEVPLIFDRYWQAKHTKGGAGLGLYISKGLVEAHGGRIWVESIVGEGTTVCFTVPESKAIALPPAAKRVS